MAGTLDQLGWLDGKEIEKSERILAKQVTIKEENNVRNGNKSMILPDLC